LSANKTLIVIAGPTAVGKTKVSIEVAKKLNCEIISADSRQFFKEISIGTAKPTLSELAEVKHHFIDILSVTEKISAGDFENLAIQKLDDLFKKDDFAIITGGSGLYIDAVCEGIDDFPEISESSKLKTQNLFDSKGIEGLQELIKEKDPEYFNQVDLQNKARLFRAVEVILEAQLPYSSFKQSKPKQRPFKIIKFCLEMPREELYDRINLRVDEMLKDGLISEVKSNIKNKQTQALKTVGYKELFKYFDGEYTLNQAIDKIKQHTRNYAKRQITWFKKSKNSIFIEVTSPSETAKKIVSQITLAKGF
jgi:tRNA dimethylallyltransferase